jgi:2'-5' RNA ligase
VGVAPPPETLRLFVAAGVPAPVRDAVAEAAAPLHASGGDLRWTDPAAWHLTVAFLGRTETARLGALTAALDEVASAAAPFPVRLRPAAGRGGRSSVLWVELEPSPPFTALAATVQAALGRLGLRTEERAFRPHLTLARARGRASVPRSLAQNYRGPALTWTIESLDVVRSHLGRGGARYETLMTCPFGQSDGE